MLMRLCPLLCLTCLPLVAMAQPAPWVLTPEGHRVDRKEQATWTPAALQPGSGALPPDALPGPRAVLERKLKQRLKRERLRQGDRTQRIHKRAARRVQKGLRPPRRADESVEVRLAWDAEAERTVAVLQLTWSQTWVGPEQRERACPPCPCSRSGVCAPCARCVPRTIHPSDRALAVVGYTLAARYEVDRRGRLVTERVFLAKPLPEDRVRRQIRRWRKAKHRPRRPSDDHGLPD